MMIAINNPRFIVLSEKLRGKIFEISKDEMSIGCHDDNDICIDDASVSEHHADIFRRELDDKIVCVLRDNNSLNGTRVNNVVITGEQVLKNSDIIQFGEIEGVFDSWELSIEERSPVTKPLKIELKPFGCVLIRDEKRIRMEKEMLREYGKMKIKIQFYPFWKARQRIKQLFYLKDQKRYMTADELLKNKPEIEVEVVDNRFLITFKTLPMRSKERYFHVLMRKLSKLQVSVLAGYAEACRYKGKTL